MAVELQKTTLELRNITFNAVGLEMDSELEKVFNNTMSDFTKPQNAGD